MIVIIIIVTIILYHYYYYYMWAVLCSFLPCSLRGSTIFEVVQLQPKWYSRASKSRDLRLLGLQPKPPQIFPCMLSELNLESWLSSQPSSWLQTLYLGPWATLCRSLKQISEIFEMCSESVQTTTHGEIDKVPLSKPPSKYSSLASNRTSRSPSVNETAVRITNWR